MAVQRDARGIMIAGPLANVSVAYRNKNYIADRVFPIIDRVAAKAKILVYKKGAWFRDEAGIRGPGARANRGTFPYDYVDVNTKEYAFAKEVTDEDRRMAKEAGAPPLQPDQDAIEFATDKVDLKKEVRVAQLVKTSTWNGVAAGGTDAAGAFAAGTGNTFLAEVAAKKELIRSKTGFKPNAMVIDNGTYESLKLEATILDRIKYTQRGIVTADLLAALLELDYFLVGDAIKSTAVEKKDGTDFTASNVWEVNAGKGMVFLFYRPATPGLKIPSSGYQAREAYANGLIRRTETWRENAEHQDVYEVAEETDILAVDTDLGYLWKDTLLT
ncbi:MAG: hypothetical protein M0024_01360 [Nitrospiraceae bacterium]|nr:hypothetical protein [Nitrospiraceae bacterium]